MNVKFLWAVIIFLALLVLAEAGYIYRQRSGVRDAAERAELDQKGYSEKAMDAQWEELEKWHRKVRGQIGAGNPLLDPDFDGFFNDRFFGRKYSPFTEMERIHRHMMDTLRESERILFDDAWGKWYGRRMLMGQFAAEVTRTDREVALAIRVPGLAAKTANIDITDDRIKISFSAKTSSEEKSAGGFVKKGSSQSYLKIVPVPEDAVPGSGKVEMDGELVKIKFDRRKTGQ